MSEDQSFAQNVFEQLSDNISRLILLVIELKERDAVVPVNEIGLVANSVSTISNVSKLLASEYSDFHQIRDKINDASNKLQNIHDRIITNLKDFSNTSDRKLAWSNLINSCRELSEESMNLLEVVYDADLKRLEMIAVDCYNLLDQLHLDQVHKDLDKFAELVSNSVSTAIRFSSYLESKSQELSNTLPIVQMSIKSQSNQIVTLANKLIDTTNDILDESKSDTTESQQLFSSLKSKIKMEIDKSLKEIDDHTPKLIKKSLLKPDLQSQPIDSSNNNNNNSLGEDKPNESIPIIEEINLAILKSAIELFRASCRGDGLAVQTISDAFEKLTDILAEQIKTSDSSYLQGLLSDLKQEIPKYIQSSFVVVQNPMNSHFINKMLEPMEVVQDIILKISKECTPLSNVMLNTLKAKEETLGILSDQNQLNPAAVIATLKNLTKNQQTLKTMVTPNDPVEIIESIEKLNELLPKHILAAKNYLQNPSNAHCKNSFMEMSQNIRVPLSKLISLMEPSSANDQSAELLAGLSGSTTKSLIECAQNQDWEQLDRKTKELETTVSNLVAMTQSELVVSIGDSLDSTPKSIILKDISDKLIQLLSNRRQIISKLKNEQAGSSQHQDIYDQLESIGTEVTVLSKALVDSLKSDVSLLKLKLVTAAKDGNLPLVLDLLNTISNRASSSLSLIDCSRDIITSKLDGNQLKLLDSHCQEINEFLLLLDQECKTVIPEVPNDTSRIEFLTDQIINLLSIIDQKLDQLDIKSKTNNNTTNNNNSIDSSSNEVPVIDEQDLIISQLLENEMKREKQQLEEYQVLENQFSQQKLIVLLSELLQNIKDHDAQKSMTTMKLLIVEQEKIIHLANDIVSKTKSLDFREQIDYSLGLLKQSISICIKSAGKKLSENSILMEKAVKTVKKSVIELGHLLKINNDIEILTAYQLLLQQQSNQSLPILSSHNAYQMLLKHFKDHYLLALKNQHQHHQVDSTSALAVFDKIQQYQQNANVILDKVILDDLFNLLIHSDSLFRGSLQHQMNCRYHIQTAFELGKNELISLSVQKIVGHQSDLIQVANEYLISEQCNQLDKNIRQLLGNSLKTVNNSLIEQVEVTIKFIEQNGQTSNSKLLEKDYSNLDKLLTVIDTVKESCELAVRSVFNSNLSLLDPEQKELIIKQSVSSILPTLSLTVSKMNLNPNDDTTKSQYLELLKEIIEPLESMALNSSTTSSEASNAKTDEASQNDEESISKSKNKKILKLILKEYQHLDKLLSHCLEMDAVQVVDSSKGLVKTHQELMSLCDQITSQPIEQQSTDTQSQIALITDIGKELTQLIPLMLSTIKQALQSTDIKQVVTLFKKASYCSRQIKRNLSHLYSLVLPFNTVQYYHKKIQSLNTQLSSNISTSVNNQQLKHKLTKLDFLSKLVIKEASEQLSSLTFYQQDKKQKLSDIIKELEYKLTKKSSDNVNSLESTLISYSQSPNSPTTKANFDKARVIFLECLDRLVQEYAAISSQLVLLLRESVLKIIGQACKGNFIGVVEQAKLILLSQKNLKQQLQKDLESLNNDPERKQLIQSLCSDVDLLIPDLIKSSKDLILQPSEPLKRDYLENLQTRILYPISLILKNIHLSNDQLTLEALVHQHQSLLVSIDQGLKQNKGVQEFQSNLNTLTSIHSNLCQLISDSSSDKSYSNELQKNLKSLVSDISSIGKDYQAHLSQGTFTPSIETEKDIALSSLSLQISQIHHKYEFELQSSNIAKYQSKKKLQDQLLVSPLSTSTTIPISIPQSSNNSNNTNSPNHHHLDKSSTPSTSVQNLINHIKSNNLLPIANSPTKIEKYLSLHGTEVQQNNPLTNSLNDFKNKQLKQNASNNNNNNNTIVISKPIHPLQPKRAALKLNSQPSATNSITPIPTNSTPPVKVTLVDTFINESKIIENLNSSIHQISLIGKELETFALASKTNQKQLLVLSSRNLSTLISQTCNEIINISNQSSNLPLKTKMVQGVNTLKTIGCQIKILSGVKAASDSNLNPDSDFQLTSIVKLLSTQLREINDSIISHYKTGLR
ncbi:filament-interacting protein [Tieghemostelium lacteum]|uniref:Filament-interacting protein n=1 Tax=Tieghemostelium lacteum TaxID=361077 RepID=A0A151ZAH8_TIELA|nr:filament-interacting protein [Tieghemostelium lacteum]|eukprot:KYQ90949.1 filament-interacting protein [Tieghemostelium lacteum]